jgi:hypothetical protein
MSNRAARADATVLRAMHCWPPNDYSIDTHQTCVELSVADLRRILPLIIARAENRGLLLCMNV